MRKIIFTLFACILFTTGQAQDIAAIFSDMPSAFLPQLEVNRRKDMIDYMKAGQKSVGKNKLNGESEMISLTDDFLEVRLSEKGALQLRKFPTSDTTAVIAVVNKVWAPACDSRIAFFTTDWKPIEINTLFPVPQLNDFAGKGVGNEVYAQAESMIDMELKEYNLSPDQQSISVKLTIKDYLPKEIYEQISPVFPDESITYFWNGRKFEKQNKK